jgi:hypothetical protein
MLQLHGSFIFRSNEKNATVGIYVDGALVGTQNPNADVLSFKAGTINAGLHSVIVRAVKGRFSLKSVSVSMN